MKCKFGEEHEGAKDATGVESVRALNMSEY